ncbi:MAG: hypothetical protein U1D35_04770 [Paracoccaceae bacterium]|nr:hypothetical protein [Paracoccaceae bacterium]
MGQALRQGETGYPGQQDRDEAALARAHMRERLAQLFVEMQALMAILPPSQPDARTVASDDEIETQFDNLPL